MFSPGEDMSMNLLEMYGQSLAFGAELSDSARRSVFNEAVVRASEEERLPQEASTVLGEVSAAVNQVMPSVHAMQLTPPRSPVHSESSTVTGFSPRRTSLHNL